MWWPLNSATWAEVGDVTRRGNLLASICSDEILALGVPMNHQSVVPLQGFKAAMQHVSRDVQGVSGEVVVPGYEHHWLRSRSSD